MSRWLLTLLLMVLCPLMARAQEVVPVQALPTVAPIDVPHASRPAAQPTAIPAPGEIGVAPPQQPIPAFVTLPVRTVRVSHPATATPLTAPPVAPALAPTTSPVAVDIPSPGLAPVTFATTQGTIASAPRNRTGEFAADAVVLGGLLASDVSVHNSVGLHGFPGLPDRVAQGFVWFGDGLNDMAICELLRLSGDERTREAGDAAFRAVLNAGVDVQVMKTLFGRGNPDAGGIEGTGKFFGPTFAPGRDSFPSGHTATAFAMATALADYYPNQKVPLYGAATAVGLSTIARHFHWPADVFAGALLGIASGKEAIHRSPNLFDVKF